ncbi:MAG: LPP20 family lipoprotein [Bacteroidota bacterium]
MKRFAYIFFIASTLLVACKGNKGMKVKPDWVHNRPTNENYYVGVGIASKLNNPFDYQQIAKKNALNDLISEIKVTVSANSVLSQFQDNTQFKQQFESDVKITALNTIEEFNVVDSWEDKDYFWIYYRLSKEEFKDIRRRKLLAAIQKAEDYYTLSEAMPREQLVQSIRLRIKALVALQSYLGEDVQTTFHGKNVFLVNELVNSIQHDLYEIQLKSTLQTLNGKIGKPIAEPFDVSAFFRDSLSGKIAVPYLPVYLFIEQGKIDGSLQTETDQSGVASFAIAKILDKNPVQLLRIAADMNRIMRVDSLNTTLQTLLLRLDMPSTNIRMNVAPIKIFMQSSEQNLSKAMSTGYFESTLKKILVADGCVFVPNVDAADYILSLQSNTKSLGIIWGNMRTVSLDMSISLTECNKKMEVYKNGLNEIKGFQTTDENAGIDAYRTACQQLIARIYPSLNSELMQAVE